MSDDALDESAVDWDVEMTGEIADQAELFLQEFATEAELDVALVVEKSGGLIAGVTARENVDVSTIGALVAGAFGTMGALSRELGEVDLTESFHHGEDDLLYMRQLGDRFILLGAAGMSHPAGLIREAAAQISGKLEKLLLDPEDGDKKVEDPATEFAAEVEESPFEAADASEEIVDESESAAAEETQTVPMPAIGPAVRSPESKPETPAGEESEAAPAKGPRYVFEIG